MGFLRLHELIHLYRDEIIRRSEMTQGAAEFLDQLMVELQNGPSRTDAISEVVMPGGDQLMSRTSTVSQVTQPYRGIGRSVMELALELEVPVSVEDIEMLDRCLDAAIAHAVTRHVSSHKTTSGGSANLLQDLTDTAISAFEVLQTGTVGVKGTTGTLVLRSLRDIAAIAKAPSEVR
jgi:hypothetical protein